MILPLLIVIPLVGAALSWRAGVRGAEWARWTALLSLLLDLGLVLASAPAALTTDAAEAGSWWLRFEAPWIPRFGIALTLALDGLSWLLVTLTLVLGVVSVLISWREIGERVGFFHFNLLASVAGVLGVFLALDLFLFFVFWEIMLVPMYLLIAVWGHERRLYAAYKFFIFTQASGLLMLVSILALVLSHQADTGVLTFDYRLLKSASVAGLAGFWMMLGFFIAFAVKLPMVPVHTWLPDAHTQAPTAGSVLLAGILLKTGAYGLFRFTLTLFPEASQLLAPMAMTLGVVGILYGAVLAYGQTDIKRLIAYTSVSHMGFILIGVYSWQTQALQGAVMQMLAHGVSTSALFMIAGMIQKRWHTRELGELGGLWSLVPQLAALGLFFSVASLGMPGLGNFVGEFLVLLGSFQVAPVVASVAALGLIAASVYALYLVHYSFYGTASLAPAPDLNAYERAAMTVMAVLIVALGLFPQPAFELTQPWIDGLVTPGPPLALAGGNE